jgi:hypothetical protein
MDDTLTMRAGADCFSRSGWRGEEKERTRREKREWGDGGRRDERRVVKCGM